MYNYRVELNNVTLLTTEEAQVALEMIGRQGAVGLKYFDGGVGFSSHTAEDVIQVFNKSFWDHHRPAHRVQVGDTIYIATNKVLTRKLGGVPLVIKATATSVVYKVESTDTTWVSVLQA